MMRIKNRVRLVEGPFSRVFLKILSYFKRLFDQRGQEIWKENITSGKKTFKRGGKRYGKSNKLSG